MKKNSFDSDTLKNNIGKKHTMEEMKNRNGFLKKLLCLAVVFAGIGICEVAQGQTQYVFMRNNNTTTYYYANGSTWSNSNTFSPSYIWTVSNSVPSNNGRYLIISRGGNWNNYTYTPSLSTNTSADYTFDISDGNVLSNSFITGYSWGGAQYSTHYLPYDFGNLATNTSYTNCVIAYEVTTSTGLAVSTKPTITGSDELTTTEDHRYTHATATYQAGYTNYTFNSANHYFDEDGNSFSSAPAAATCSGYTWSLTANNYATVNASTGVVSVDSLPDTDLTLTLTCTASFTGGTPTVPANTTLSDTMQITIQGTKPSAPIITVNGTEITLSTNATGSTTIRYTLDGTDPTATTGTVFSGTFDVSGQTSSPVTIKAVTVRNGSVSSVSEEEVTLTLPEPVITVNAEAGTASIACSNTDATIYYTTDGSEPSDSNGTKYTGTITGLSMMTTIKAIAIRDGWNNSSVASDILTIPSGVSGGVVTLFDYELHSWSYYSDEDCPIHCLNPADIKITYNGNGTDNMTDATGDEAIDRPTSFSLDASGVQVGPGDTANKFIYYKTLERQSPDGTGDLPYTTIPNPFQVRPYGESGTVTITPKFRNVYISWSSDYWRRNNTQAQVRFSYTDINGTVQTSGYYTSNGNITIQAKVGTTITVYSKSCRNGYTNYSPTITAKYDNNNGTQIVTYQNTSTTENSSTSNSTISSSPTTVSVSAYRGFYAWRVKSLSTGLTIKDAENTNTTYAVNSIIPAERKILFVTSNEYNNEVVFEALWAQAYVQTGTTDLSTYVSADVPSAYERNFHVVNTSTAASNFQKDYPCTVIGHEPNSSTLNNTRTITGGFTANADTKFEDLIWNGGNNSTISGNNHNLTIGRGVSASSGSCATYVYGVNNNFDENLNYTLRIESGKFGTVAFLSGYSGSQGNGYSTLYFRGTDNHIKAVLGNDYDRANEDDQSLTITDNVHYGYIYQEYGLINQDVSKEVLVVSTKSGSYMSNNVSSDASEAFYMGIGSYGNPNAQTPNVGMRTLIIEGGQFKHIAGGVDANNSSTQKSFNIRMHGGTVKGSIYGAGAFAAASGIRSFIFTGGSVEGWIACGANGTTTTNTGNDMGRLPSDTYLYVGGTTKVGTSDDTQINTIEGGNVFGAGNGGTYNSGRPNSGEVQNSTVVIADETDIYRDVFGGGNQGHTANTANVYMLGGTINGNLYVGSNKNSGTTANLLMTGGIVKKGIYGGSNSSGTISGNVTLNINGGQVGTPSSNANIHGGGYGSSTIISSNVEIKIGADNQNTSGVTVYGDVYGGSALGSVNGTSTNTTNHTYVTLNAGTINGSLYGGALGNADTEANVYAPVVVTVNGGSVTGAVYGCNNVNGAPQSTVKVDINGTDQPESGYALAEVYGGGNKAAYGGTPVVAIHNCDNSIGYVYGGGNATDVAGTDITVWGGNTIGYVFGGGNGAGQGNPGANVGTGGTNVKIRGGSIDHVFGGGNMKGTISGGIVVSINKQTESDHDACEMHIAEVYGGGNKAASAAGSITVGCTGGEGEGIGDLYGGANQAGITGNIGLNITGGSINRIFGGNNITGAIDGTITVNVNWKTTDPCGYNYIGTVFGGGNNAPYNGTPEVNIKNGTVSQSVYGGGKGIGAIVKGTNVTIGDADASHCAVVVENVYGGGDAAAVQGNTLVTYNDNNASSSVSNLFGGGNKAGLSGTATVNMTAGKVTAGIYGGCNFEGGVQGAITVNINGGTLGASGDGNAMSSGIFGGGYGSATSSEGNVTVNIGDEAGTYIPVIYGDIYGGSALGNVNDAATDTTIVNFLNGTLHGNLYGGGLGDADNAAKVNGKVIVNISNSTQTEANCNIDLSDATIYGCNNAYGSPQDSVIVNIYKTAHNTTNAATYTVNDGTNGEPTYAIAQVFGGGNQADYAPENGAANSTKVAKVHIYNCNNTIRRVFGGGNAADATGVETIVDGGRFDYVFGGGNGEDVAANIGAGGTNLTVNSGIINHLFGGSNERGTITGSMAVAVNNTGGCTENIKEFFCGNNLADIGTSSNPVNLVASIGCGTIFGDVYGGCNLANIYGNVTLTIEGGTMDNVYGGSKGRSATSDPNNSTPKAANIYGNTTLNIYAGAIGNAFGGSNINGNITGSIQVNVDWAQSSCSDKSIGNIFGASNLATYTPTISGKYPEVNILNGTVTQNVYGGGKGESAVVTGSPVVTIGDTTSDHESYVAEVTGDVYGGGDAANVLTGTPEVKVLAKDNTSIGNVYGGGNAADVPATKVTIDGGTIGMVFGGGHGDKTANPQTEANVSGSSNVTITGGTINKVFATANSKGTVGSSTVTVEKGASSRAMHITEVYGGGNEAAGNAGTLTIGCTGGATESIGSVFGGANNADISSDITLNITGGRITDAVYGGNNSGGTVNGDIAINVTWANSGSCDTNYLGSVYGGGYGASTATSGDVTVNIGTYAESTLSGSAIVSGDVYGGSALGSVCDTATDEVSVNILSGTVNGNIYGGGLGDASDANKGKVNGKVTVNIGTIDNSDNLIGSATLGGMVFGGNNTNGSPQADVNVNIYKTAHTSGNDLDALAAKAGNTSTVEIEDLKAVAALIESSTPSDTVAGNAMFAIKAVYGGGNKANYIPASGKKSTVTVFGCEENTIKYVYGGGRAASSNETHVEIKGGHIYQVFAGGDGSTGVGANIGLMPDNTTEYGSGHVNLTISAGAIYQAFGGSNTLGKINGETYFNLKKDANCDLQIVETFAGNNLAEINGDQTFTIKCGTYWNDVYGGSNKAPITGNVTLNIEGGVINRAFGGSKSASIDGNVTVNVYGGTIHELYGGNNVWGNITGSITVNVDWTEENECNDAKNIDYVYGGGNLADYEPTNSSASSPQVNIIKATVDTAVYGGGYMAFVKSNPNVVIGADRTKNMAGETISNVSNLAVSIGLNVFGGGNAAEIKGNTNVKVTGISTVGKNIFGGGNEAAVTGNTEVLLDKRAKVFGNVYGGGNRGAIGGDTKVIVNSIK